MMNYSYVLVVDDDPGMHTLVGLMLRPLSLEVRYALTGYTAIDMVASERPTLIILDLQMPGLDGFGLLERLGEKQETADIPVMIFSAYADVAHINGYEWPAQVVRILQKPKVRPSELRALVKAQLE